MVWLSLPESCEVEGPCSEGGPQSHPKAPEESGLRYGKGCLSRHRHPAVGQDEWLRLAERRVYDQRRNQEICCGLAVRISNYCINTLN